MLQHTRWTMLCIVGFCELKKNLQQHRPHRPHRPPMPSTRSSVIYSVAFQFRGNISLRCAMQFLWGPTERCTCFVYMALRGQGKSQKTNVVRFRRQMLTAKRIAKSKCKRKRINGAYDDRRCDEFMATHNNNKKRFKHRQSANGRTWQCKWKFITAALSMLMFIILQQCLAILFCVDCNCNSQTFVTAFKRSSLTKSQIGIGVSLSYTTVNLVAESRKLASNHSELTLI